MQKLPPGFAYLTEGHFLLSVTMYMLVEQPQPFSWISQSIIHATQCTEDNYTVTHFNYLVYTNQCTITQLHNYLTEYTRQCTVTHLNDLVYTNQCTISQLHNYLTEYTRQCTVTHLNDGVHKLVYCYASKPLHNRLHYSSVTQLHIYMTVYTSNCTVT